MTFVFHLAFIVLFQYLPHHAHGHSWVVKVGLDGGRSRGGVNSDNDHVLQRYFCPLPNLEDCQPDPKHEITLTPDALRPCRAGVESSPRSVIERGELLYISWMGNGHVNNGQSDGSCVRLMMTPYESDPDFSSFVELPGGSCIDYWHFDPDGKEVTDTEIMIPVTTPPGKYTILWYWDFTDFIFSSCMDIDVTGGDDYSPPPSPAITTDPHVDTYLSDGCTDLPNPDQFCVNYLGAGSYCKTSNTDECNRSVCHGGDFLLPCNTYDSSEPSPSPTPNDAEVDDEVDNILEIYLAHGCSTTDESLEMPPTFCADNFGSYCKEYQADECNRSICHGHDFALLNECTTDTGDDTPPGDDEESSYYSQGCSVLADPNSFCSNLISGSYCKDWQYDDCGRSICQGHDHGMLVPCSP